jgi:hypothetical protein
MSTNQTAIWGRAFKDSVSFTSVGVVRVFGSTDTSVVSDVKEVFRMRQTVSRTKIDKFFDNILRRNELRLEPASLLFILRKGESQPTLMRDAMMVEIVSGEIETITVGDTVSRDFAPKPCLR